VKLWRSALLLACALAFIGCASALKEPRPIPEIGRGGEAPEDGSAEGPAAGAAEVEALLARAGALFAERGPDAAGLESVRLAARTFLRAAAADVARLDGLIGAVRAEVWLTDHETDAAEREQAARSAVEAAQWCGRIAPADPACDYWLGAALGVQARERPATALSALPKIEEVFRRALAVQPALDQAGPDRALALLYVRAPGWPTGPGDPDLGLQHARMALARRPDYPPNLMATAEALAATGDAAASRDAYRRALDLARGLAAGGDRDAPEWVAEAGKALRDSGDE
jgi:hypothetical protein